MSYIKPQDQIQDGVTDRSPTENAVYDALALKANTNLQNLSFSGSEGQFLSIVGGVPAWAALPSTLPSQGGNLNKVLVTDGSTASWQYAGLGAGSLGTGNVIVGRSKPSSLSGTSTILIGESTAGNAISSGDANTIIGFGSASTMTTGSYNVLVGYGTLASSNASSCVAIGTRALELTTGNDNVGIGGAAGRNLGSRSNSIYIGSNASDASSGFGTGNGRIAIGSGAVAAPNSLAAGSASYPVNKVVFGKGQEDVQNTAGMANTNVTITTTSPRTGWTNVDASAGTITIAAAQGTGNGLGADIIFSTAPAGAPGTALNAHVERLRVTTTGAVQVPNYILSPQLYDAGTKAADFTLDLGTNGPCQQVTINAAGPLILTLSNPVTGGAYLLKIVQGATTGTITFPVAVKWGAAGAPTLSNVTGKIDIINLYYDGTNYYGTYALGF